MKFGRRPDFFYGGAPRAARRVGSQRDPTQIQDTAEIWVVT